MLTPEREQALDWVRNASREDLDMLVIALMMADLHVMRMFAKAVEILETEKGEKSCSRQGKSKNSAG